MIKKLINDEGDEGDESDKSEISYYNGEPIRQPRCRWTLAQQLELLDTHPIFTGRCPNCEMPFPLNNKPVQHWLCQFCGWKFDNV